MKYLQSLAMLAILGLSSMTFLRADAWDKQTDLKINQPLVVSNTTLQPGEYVLRLLPTDSDRHVVQILNKDGTHVITTVLAIPNERLQPTGKSAFAFWEVPAGMTAALRAWFYPGDNFGQEFLYPKEKAEQISAANNDANVPTLKEGESASGQTQSGNEARATSSNERTQPESQIAQATPNEQSNRSESRSNEPSTAQNPESRPAPSPDQVTTPNQSQTDRGTQSQVASQPERDNQTKPETLPKTGSEIPLIALVGFVAAVSALTLRIRNHA